GRERDPVSEGSVNAAATRGRKRGSFRRNLAGRQGLEPERTCNQTAKHANGPGSEFREKPMNSVTSGPTSDNWSNTPSGKSCRKVAPNCQRYGHTCLASATVSRSTRRRVRIPASRPKKSKENQGAQNLTLAVSERFERFRRKRLSALFAVSCRFLGSAFG